MEKALHPVRTLSQRLRQLHDARNDFAFAFETKKADAKKRREDGADFSDFDAATAAKLMQVFNNDAAWAIVDLRNRFDELQDLCLDIYDSAEGIGHHLQFGMTDAGAFETTLRRAAKEWARLIGELGMGERTSVPHLYFQPGTMACEMVSASSLADVLESVALAPVISGTNDRSGVEGFAPPLSLRPAEATDSIDVGFQKAIDDANRPTSISDRTRGLDKSAGVFSFRDGHLTIMVEIAARGRLVKASQLDGKPGMPPYDTLNKLLSELESADPPFVTRPRGRNSGFEVTKLGINELKKRGLLD